MEKKTMGNFMAALRKANGYTQQQIADKLNVSNKTISKWECDDGYPEISMLPAIAEIYGVTVDELLRGEKANQTAEKETNNQKAEEQIKYLFNRSASKFNIFYLISLGLGLVAVATSIRLIFQMISFNFDLFGGRIIIASAAVSPILFSIVSVILMVIGFNHFVESFKNQDILEKQTYDTKIFRAIKRFGLVIALVFTAIMVIVCAFTLPDLYLETVLVCFAAMIVFSFIIAFLFCKIMRKKYDIQTLCNTNKKQGKINIYKEKRKLRKANISPEIQKLRKKHTKITAIVLSIILVISIPLSFIRVVKDHLKTETLCFTDYVGEKYESIEEAELDYYKLKKHITGEQLMYEPMFGMVDEKTGEYNLEVMQIYTEFKKTDKGYKKYKDRLDPDEADLSFTFKTKEELDKFIKEATLDCFYEDFSMIDRNITFNDDTLEITYSRASIISDRYFRLPRQFIFLTGEILIILGASALIYKLKIENL